MKKPTKPTETLPSSFGGIKENFTDDKQATGYEPDVPDILGGANLNYTIDTIGKKDIYHDAINDFVNATPIDNTITVDSNNDLVYEDISNITKYEDIPENIPTTQKCILVNREGTYLNPYTSQNEGVGWRLFDTKFSDHVLLGDEASGWALLGTYTLTTDTKFYDTCVAEKEAAGDAKEIEVENGYSFTGYENKNGHIYYDISEKANVDQIYNVTGSAWFYGIDTTNKRIFLPRNDNFVQSSGNTTKVGNFVEHGLPSHTHNVPVTGSTTTSTAGASYSGTTGRVLTSGGVVTSEPDNTIYGNSDTVQPRAIRQLCYMCVGNVIINEDEIDVETLVGDVRNKANIDLDNLSDTGEARFTEKANDSAVVHKTGNETVAGVKTFSDYTIENGTDFRYRALDSYRYVSTETPTTTYYVWDLGNFTTLQGDYEYEITMYSDHNSSMYSKYALKISYYASHSSINISLSNICTSSTSFIAVKIYYASDKHVYAQFGSIWGAGKAYVKAPYTTNYKFAPSTFTNVGYAAWGSLPTGYTVLHTITNQGNVSIQTNDNTIRTSHNYNCILAGAQMDYAGNVITSTYLTKTNAADTYANQSLSNLNDTGLDKINQSKALETGDVSTDSDVYSDIQKYRHSTFDLSKFTVVGSPTITDDGIASGFSNSNYLTYTNLDFSNASTVKIQGKYKLSSNTTSSQSFIIFNSNSVRLSLESAKLVARIGSSSNYAMNYTFQTNDVIEWSWTFNESNSVLAVTKINDVEVNYTVYPSIPVEKIAEVTTITIGHITGYNFLGSIDLKSISITVDGVEVFSGNKTGIDTIKSDNYTVVGSPTITEDGIASNFSASNYLTTGESFNLGAADSFSFEFCVDITAKTATNSPYCIFASYNSASSTCIMIYWQVTDYFSIYLSSDGKNWGIRNNVAMTPQGLSLGKYYCRFNFTGTAYEFYTSTDGIAYTQTWSYESTTKVYSINQQVFIGNNITTSRSLSNGSIDLNSFRIYVDGNLVYQPCLKIPYTLSKTGSKIVNSTYRDRVEDMYEQYGVAPYYTIDEDEQNFTLPQGEIYGMIQNVEDKIQYRNIGEIVASTLPLTDAGLHLLDGALIQGDGIYKDFVTYIKGLYDSSANYFCTEDEWQSAITTYGSCGKFVYDSSANTVRLPKVSDILQGTTDVTALGSLVEAGLPNITGNFVINGDGANNRMMGMHSSTGAFYGTSYGTVDAYTGSQGGSQGSIFNFDASRSSSIYGNSSTVQPQTIKVLYYIVLATSTKTDVQVDIDNIATDLNNKVDLDGTNATFAHITESYVNGTSWYRIYSDGWCEQGGIADYGSYAISGSIAVTFLKTFKNTNYSVLASMKDADAPNDYLLIASINPSKYTTSGVTLYFYGNGSGDLQRYFVWEAKGYIS